MLPKNWPNFIETSNLRQAVHCDGCKRICAPQNSEFQLSTFVFVEFNSAMVTCATFPETIFILGVQYNLGAIVKHIGSHFTCAIFQNKWLVFDDLNNNCHTFASLNDLYANGGVGWFFAVYVHLSQSHILAESLCNGFAPHDASFVNETAVENKTNANLFDHDYSIKPEQSNHFNPLDHDYSCKINSSKRHSVSTLAVPSVPSKRKKKATAKTSEKAHKTVSTAELSKFHQSLEMTIRQCISCFEAWPVRNSSKKDVQQYTCARCIRDTGTPKKFSHENNTVPGPVPSELRDLSQCEEMLIARAFPVMQVYLKPRYGTMTYKGH